MTVDGRQPLSDSVIAAVTELCAAAEDRDGAAAVVVHVGGTPGPGWAGDLRVATVSRWERGLRRLERLPVVTIAVATGDCGGAALDALLVTDYRIASATSRLVQPAVAGATWPGMALYRLARQAAAAAPVRRAMLFGAPMTAAAALSVGLIDEVSVRPAEALAKAIEAARTTQGTELAVIRQLMSEAPATSFEDALGVHLAACDRRLRRAR